MKLNIDDQLIHDAIEHSNTNLSPSDLVQELLKAFIRMQASKSLAALGGKAPKMRGIPR
jgi:hypothetical protein